MYTWVTDSYHIISYLTLPYLTLPYLTLPNLTYPSFPRYVRGADPIIKLMDEDGDVMENLAIDKWNTDSVEEFLNTYLLPPHTAAQEDANTPDRTLNEV